MRRCVEHGHVANDEDLICHTCGADIIDTPQEPFTSMELVEPVTEFSANDYPVSHDPNTIPTELPPVVLTNFRTPIWQRTWLKVFLGLLPLLLLGLTFAHYHLLIPRFNAQPHVPGNVVASPYPAVSDSTLEAAYSMGTPQPLSMDELLAATNWGANIAVANDRAPGGEAGRTRDLLVDRGFSNVIAKDYPGDSGLVAHGIDYLPGYRSTALTLASILGVSPENLREVALTSSEILVILIGPVTASAG